MPSYLLEIGCEEIPAAFIPSSSKYLLDEWTKRLSALNLPFSSIESGGTPRRLYVNIEGLPVSQVDKTEIIMGPPANIAFNSDGSLTEAAKKFAASKGINESSLKATIYRARKQQAVKILLLYCLKLHLKLLKAYLFQNL